MGTFNIRQRKLISKSVRKICTTCRIDFPEDSNYCTKCGSKLETKVVEVYANISKRGITSFSYKTSDGITINSNGRITNSLGNGISYTT